MKNVNIIKSYHIYRMIMEINFRFSLKIKIIKKSFSCFSNEFALKVTRLDISNEIAIFAWYVPIKTKLILHLATFIDLKQSDKFDIAIKDYPEFITDVWS